MRQKIHSWVTDPLFRSVMRGSGYLFSSSMIMAGLSMLQGIFVVRLIGMQGLGIVTIVTTLVSNIHRLLSFRMSEVVVRYLGTALEQDDLPKAGRIVSWAAIVETCMSLVAFFALILLAPWAVNIFNLQPDFSFYITLYGSMLLGNLAFETSTGVLQCFRKFDRLAKINIGQSLLTAGLILAAFLTRRDVLWILTAYLAGKLFSGIAVSISAWSSLGSVLGERWWRNSQGGAGEGRNLLRFAVNTNLHGTVNLLVRDNIPLLLGALRTQTEVGYFKLALSIINLVMLPIEPFIWPTYTEITRTIARGQWQATRQLLKRVSSVAAVWTITAGGFIALVGPWMIPLIYGSDSVPTYPAVLWLMIGYGFANIFNWNRPLLLALGKPGYPLVIAALVGLAEIGLTLLLVPEYGYLMQSAILSGFFVISISIIIWRGLTEMQARERQEHLSQVYGGAG